MIDFKQSEVPEGSSSESEWEYVDPSTRRQFEVRLLQGPASIEKSVDSGCDRVDVRYMVSELIPSRRFLNHAHETKIVPGPEWIDARKSPSAAYSLLAEYSKKWPGFKYCLSGCGISSHTIFYPDLEECSRQIENALLGDYWLCSEEPIKKFTFADRCEIHLEDKRRIDEMVGSDQFYAALTEIAGLLGSTERAQVSCHLDLIRIDVDDSEMEYPESCRMLLFFDKGGRVAPKGFVRGGWGNFADRIARRRLARFDGAEGMSRGMPAYGQKIGCLVDEIPGVDSIEVLHKQEGTADKVYGCARVAGRYFHFWGRYGVGKFSVKAAKGTGYEQMSAKRGRGYKGVSHNQVPDFAARLVQAVKLFSSQLDQAESVQKPK